MPTPHDRKAARIVSDLRIAIQDGRYRPGDFLPSEQDLMKIYGCAKQTVRDAITRLVMDGAVVRKQGRGTMLRPVYPLRELPVARYRDGPDHPQADPEKAGLTFLDTIEDVPATAEIAESLGIPVGTTLVKRRTATRWHDLWMQLVTSYIRPDAFYRGPYYPDPPTFGLNALRDGYSDVIEQVTGRIANPAEQKALALPDCTAVMVLGRRTYRGDETVEVAEIVLPGDRNALSYTVARA